MSKSTNMLRTRRRDNNVKPNRRLDRKSSRGMLYENEELRLKTININAEIERGQSDIKKLKRENEMLKKEIWCLRDEYDKLDKLLKEKKIEFSSSSTTCSSSSDTESCSSCSEESEEVETSQNLENVQKTNLKNIHKDFDHLSVVPEEPSTENSDRTSARNSLPNDNWYDNNVIQPDQSYPIYENVPKSRTLPVQDRSPRHFFSPIQTSKSCDEMRTDQLYPGQYYSDADRNYVSKKIVNTSANNIYQNITLVPKSALERPELHGMEKTTTDLLVKMDNVPFGTSSENGLVYTNTPSQSTFSNGGNLEELLKDIESISQEILRISNLQRGGQQQQPVQEPAQHEEQKPYKSELNVVLMPTAMPLIGFEKYKNIQRSFESLNQQPLEDLSASQQNLCLLPPEIHQPPDVQFLTTPAFGEPPPLSVSPLPPPPPPQEPDNNPFFFGNLKDNYVNSDYFHMRYNPDNFLVTPKENDKEVKKSKSNDASSEQVSSENEENLKFKTTKPEKPEADLKEETQETAKSPKLSIRRKVSIHFKGKKDKKKAEAEKPDTKKHSIFDIKFGDKSKGLHQKTPSIESKKSTTETSNVEPKTPTSSDSKTSLEKRNSQMDKKEPSEKKGRKSASVSPDRKHVHVKEEDQHKKHKKHKRSDRSKIRRNTMSSIDPRLLRERSYSVCTDRSLDYRMGFAYDDSDRTSMSSCETMNTQRKMSTLSNVPLNGKVPWCGCWGNGCL
ncbi:dual specificity protein kinase splA isoform X2 [Aethina tumida]|uniref:dual specificity protein kinase splA isoform X2 n=1 Tax=Aethina tumida TaxID=116153 RepID=UPI0021486A9F|nr:dual specificity protein kinase splA isoform X2 [Aethina tumida]